MRAIRGVNDAGLQREWHNAGGKIAAVAGVVDVLNSDLNLAKV